jgi:hypothetical protein
MFRLHALACAAHGKVLLRNIPVTLAPVRGLPLSDVQLTLDLSRAEEPAEIAAVLHALMAERALVTWTLVTWTLASTQETTPRRCHGILTRCEAPRTTEGQTLMAIEMHLRPV